MKDAKYRVDVAREVCESVYKRIWDIIGAIQTAMLSAENLRLKAHIDEKEVKKSSQFAEKLRAAEEQMLERHLEKQKELWHLSPASAAASNPTHLALVLPLAALLHHHLNMLLSSGVVWVVRHIIMLS